MAKSKKRFDNPMRWENRNVGMRQNPSGKYVAHDDYEGLRLAYRFALMQLDRAARLVGKLKRENIGLMNEFSEFSARMQRELSGEPLMGEPVVARVINTDPSLPPALERLKAIDNVPVGIHDLVIHSETRKPHDEDLLEQLFWEFDSMRKCGHDRISFKAKLRWYANHFAGVKMVSLSEWAQFKRSCPVEATHPDCFGQWLGGNIAAERDCCRCLDQSECTAKSGGGR